MTFTTFRVSPTRRLFLFGIIGLLALATVTIPFTASAHETRTVADDYEFVVGFVNEPAIANDTNGIFLSVTSDGEPVEGLTGSLEAQVLYGDQTRDATLTPSFDEPGVYTSIFIPTAEGDYTFRFFGEINGVEIDETFTSSPEGFDSVQPRSNFEFPAEEGSASREVAMPVLVGGALLVLGGLGLAVRRHRAD